MSAEHSTNGGGSNPQEIQAIAERFADTPGGLMPLLHAVQERVGYVPAEAVPIIARAMNLSRAEVHGVISFYHDFKRAPRGRNVIRVCRAESCQAMGAVELASHIQHRLGIGFGETSKDGAFTLEPVFCLGNCACSPAIVVGDDIYGRVTKARFDEILARMARGIGQS
ncbi:MAG: formate dehydrogenase subunit gamma [Candidatus Binatus sp.]|uniref:formate dehydrogenase subunit gamma n=1 Tax=Candidatus Binatus sp. TaxID=2811406 RepID=UPI00271D4567|nr:formate dehydrogenase subunit gamma [Candidatus Binatus sp.]MDO8430810.1 formate dehydrogenase subunit gamma [Candidatus Binatus sp.]